MTKEISRAQAAAIMAGAERVTRSAWLVGPSGLGRDWVLIGKNTGIMGVNWRIWARAGWVHVDALRNAPRFPAGAEWVEDLEALR